MGRPLGARDTKPRRKKHVTPEQINKLALQQLSRPWPEVDTQTVRFTQVRLIVNHVVYVHYFFNDEEYIPKSQIKNYIKKDQFENSLVQKFEQKGGIKNGTTKNERDPRDD